MGVNLGIAQDFDTSESSKLFKYTVSNYSDLSSLVDVNEGDIAWVQNYSILTPTRFSGAWQYLSGVWVYGSKELQDQVSTNIAEIQQNEDDIIDLQNNKLEKGGYTGNAQDLDNAINAIDGSETKIVNGTNTTVTGTGTVGDPYIINASSGSSGPFLNPTIEIGTSGSTNINTPAGQNVVFDTVVGRNSIAGIAYLGGGSWQLPLGQYKMGFSVNASNGTNVRKNCIVNIRKNGVQDLTRTIARAYQRNFTDSSASYDMWPLDDFINMNLSGGESFSIFGQQGGSAGASNTVANECVWIIEKIV